MDASEMTPGPEVTEATAVEQLVDNNITNTSAISSAPRQPSQDNTTVNVSSTNNKSINTGPHVSNLHGRIR